MVELEAERRVDAEHALSNVDVTIHSETLRDTAPVLEGIKVRQSRTQKTHLYLSKYGHYTDFNYFYIQILIY